ncbi:FAD-dependent oxidoreductase [Altererythrobacter sp. MF3-039]|uniref:FAD-dependent oxidoreductase n=1 Tax=Altererythrobacter sp. MF3-039 TaxID=3252901 RepID=UPI00390CA344
MSAEVVIVGAGPVGLSAALRLSALGVKSVILEAEEVPPHDLRASTFHPPTLEMLDTLGLAEPLVERGLVTPHWQIRIHETGERALFDLAHIAEDTRYPFRLQCEQTTLCALAEEKARADANIGLVRGCAVKSLEQDGDGVTATGSNGEKYRGTFLIGADGARSVVRKTCGFEFEGFTYPETTILATTHFPFHDHIDGLSNVNYCWSNHGTFSLLRLPDIWRCSLYSDPHESEEEALAPGAIETKLQRIVPQESPYQVDEIRPYRIHNRIVETYRQGRVLLAGDAAHLNSPSGGMGMNGGVHDAFALAEALTEVLSGGDDALLDRYSRRRKAIAQEQILKQAHRNRTRMQERDPAARRTELAKLQAICDDPEQARDYLLKSSMIEGLRQAETIQ